MDKPRYEYKNKAETLMRGKYTNVILTLLIMGFLSSIGTGYSAGQFFMGGSASSTWMNLVSLVLGAAFAYGLISAFIEVARDREPNLEEVLLVGFKDNFVRNLICYFLMRLFIVLWALLFVIPGIIKAYAYSMSFYLLKKDAKLAGNDAITRSKEYTMGYKTDLFMLDLSYLGWYFLSIFTLGILLFWIVPKHLTARVLYYDEIYAKKAPKLAEPLAETA